jgi:hypothetical protein
MKLRLSFLILLICLKAGSPAFAYEIIHPYEEFGDLTARFDEDNSEVTVSDLAYSISEFFKAKMFGFSDKSARPDSGNYLELLKDSEKALIIYHDCYEGACQETPILEFSCRLEADLCRNPKILFKGEELSFREFLRRGDFNLPISSL